MVKGFTNAVIGKPASSEGQAVSSRGAAKEWHRDREYFVIPRNVANTFECGSGGIPIISFK